MAKEWYLRVRGKVTGPFTEVEIDTFRGRGQLQRFHEVSRDQRAWQSVGSWRGAVTERPLQEPERVVRPAVPDPIAPKRKWFGAWFGGFLCGALFGVCLAAVVGVALWYGGGMRAVAVAASDEFQQKEEELHRTQEQLDKTIHEMELAKNEVETAKKEHERINVQHRISQNQQREINDKLMARVKQVMEDQLEAENALLKANIKARSVQARADQEGRESKFKTAEEIGKALFRSGPLTDSQTLLSPERRLEEFGKFVDLHSRDLETAEPTLGNAQHNVIVAEDSLINWSKNIGPFGKREVDKVAHHIKLGKTRIDEVLDATFSFKVRKRAENTKARLEDAAKHLQPYLEAVLKAVTQPV